MFHQATGPVFSVVSTMCHTPASAHLDVPVDEANAVKVGHRLQHLLHDDSDVALIDSASVDDEIKQAAARGPAQGLGGA